jgi:hypothetical protein
MFKNDIQILEKCSYIFFKKYFHVFEKDAHGLEKCSRSPTIVQLYNINFYVVLNFLFMWFQKTVQEYFLI